MSKWAIALHGGAVISPSDFDGSRRDEYLQSLREALRRGARLTSGGAPALDIVETVVMWLENDPLYNAGKGAAYTSAGHHELDASIMDGSSLKAGAVAGVRTIRNPIVAARYVLEKSPHLLLVGSEAENFVAQMGVQRVASNYFATDFSYERLQRFLQIRDVGHRAPVAGLADNFASNSPRVQQKPHDARTFESGGTVGCVALDVVGNLAAATSTGGTMGKLPGRCGDSAIIGAGTRADNRSCAVSCTGKGEEFIRHSIASRICWMVEMQRQPIDEAITYCLTEVLKPDDGGMLSTNAATSP